MNREALIGWAVVGGVALMGAWTAYHSVRSAVGPRERMFARRVCLTIWTLAVGGTAGIVWLPGLFRWLSALGMILLVPALLYRWTIQRQLIRQLDEREHRASSN